MNQNVSDPAGNPNASGTADDGARRHDLRDLRRSNDDRMIAGVCGGLGRYTGVDPIIFRIVLATLAVFGGVGLVLYALAWLLVPDEATGTSGAERLRGSGRNPLSVLGAVALGVVGLIVLLDVLRHRNNGQIALFIIVAVIAVVLFSRTTTGRSLVGNRANGPATGPTGGFFGPNPTPPPAPAPSVAPTVAPAAAYFEPGPTVTAPLGPPAGFSPSRPLYAAPPPPPPKPPRPPSLLAPLALSVGVLVTGTLFALDASHAIDITAQAVFAAALLTIGLALVIGTWIGRARTLIAVGTILTVCLAVTAAIDVPLRGGVGDRYYAPVAASELSSDYHLGIGDQTLDLTGFAANGKTVHVTASVGVGRLLVRVPRTIAVVAHARAGAGDVGIVGDHTNGTHVNRTVSIPATTNRATGTTTPGQLVLDLRVGVGVVDVDNDESPSDPTSGQQEVLQP
jgi:phage shock protein PspC (stress-responsive transcriptional regulator)